MAWRLDAVSVRMGQNYFIAARVGVGWEEKCIGIVMYIIIYGAAEDRGEFRESRTYDRCLDI